ncbi:MAG: hypothetical protein EZS28_040496, partial [Streblomastix strix]
VDSPSTLLQGSLVGTRGTHGNGLEKWLEFSPYNVGRGGAGLGAYFAKRKLFQTQDRVV